ncbi:uncharacterized protein LOC135110719 [Scylla paramamosain]|uniref:uncharacterized protein LOC135110719 n=1 Tax=Scylla paramamosain TaxID=85552 RepID=UPI0030836F6C
MAREVILKLDRWLKAEEATTLEEVKGVIQTEQFMSQMPLSVRCELASHDVKDVMEAGRRADKYCAVRGMNGDEHHEGRKPFSSRNDGHQRYKNDSQMSSTSVHRSNQPRPNNYSFPHTYTMPPPADHNMRSAPYGSRPRSTTYYQKGSGDEGAVKCLGCGSSGHRKFQCPKGRPKPVGAVAAQRDLIKYVENMNAEIQEEPPKDEGFEHFTSKGTVKVEGSPEKVIRILRDTGANQSLILSSVLPWNEETSTGREVSCKGAGGQFSIPLHKVWLDCGYVTGEVTVGVKEALPVDGVDMLVGNDLAGGRVIPKLQMVDNPLIGMTETTTPAAVPHSTDGEAEVPELFPVCAVTRAMARKERMDAEGATQEDEGLGVLFEEPDEKGTNPECTSGGPVVGQVGPNLDFLVQKNELIKAQESDESLKSAWNEANRLGELDNEYVGYYVNNGVLMRSWRPLTAPTSDHWMVKRQIVVPWVYRKKILEMAHEGGQAELGDSPCPPSPYTCGRGTIQFPEAIPLRSINSKNIVRELVKFFSWVGIPKVLQSDQGSNFTSRAFKEILRGLKIEQRLSSAYHPQSQGCVERFHQTLKNTLRMYCEEMSVQWDEDYNLEIHHVKGSENIIADALSRAPPSREAS